jgi:hypothetical protein
VGDSAWENDKFDGDSHHNKRGRQSSPSLRDRQNERKKEALMEAQIGEMMDRRMKRDLHLGIMINMMKEIVRGFADRLFFVLIKLSSNFCVYM